MHALSLSARYYERGEDGTFSEWIHPTDLAHYGPDALPVLRALHEDVSNDPWQRWGMGDAMARLAHAYPDLREPVIETLHAALPSLHDDATPVLPEDRHEDDGPDEISDYDVVEEYRQWRSRELEEQRREERNAQWQAQAQVDESKIGRNDRITIRNPAPVRRSRTSSTSTRRRSWQMAGKSSRREAVRQKSIEGAATSARWVVITRLLHYYVRPSARSSCRQSAPAR